MSDDPKQVVVRTEGNTIPVNVIEATLRPIKVYRFDFPIPEGDVEAPTLEQFLNGVVRHTRDHVLSGYSGVVTMVDHGMRARERNSLHTFNVTVIFVPHEKCFHVIDRSQVQEFLNGDRETNLVEVDPDFHLSGDAAVWAKTFMQIVQGSGLVVDEDLMIGWFANAIMRGWDDAVAHTFEQLGIVRPGYESFKTGIPLKKLVDIGILPVTAIYPDPDCSGFAEWLEEKQQQLQSILTKEKNDE